MPRLKEARVAYSIPGFGTALPGSPLDGDQFILTDSITAPTYTWLLRYVAAKASNKWVCIGGAPGYNMVATFEARANAAYGALATAGPSFAIPVAGDYDVAIGFTCDPNIAANEVAIMSYDIGGTGAVDADLAGVWANTAGTTYDITTTTHRRKTGLTAVTLTAKYRTELGGSMEFGNRWMQVTPVAIGG